MGPRQESHKLWSDNSSHRAQSERRKRAQSGLFPGGVGGSGGRPAAASRAAWSVEPHCGVPCGEEDVRTQPSRGARRFPLNLLRGTRTHLLPAVAAEDPDGRVHHLHPAQHNLQARGDHQQREERHVPEDRVRRLLAHRVPLGAVEQVGGASVGPTRTRERRRSPRRAPFPAPRFPAPRPEHAPGGFAKAWLGPQRRKRSPRQRGAGWGSEGATTGQALLGLFDRVFPSAVLQTFGSLFEPGSGYCEAIDGSNQP